MAKPFFFVKYGRYFVYVGGAYFHAISGLCVRESPLLLIIGAFEDARIPHALNSVFLLTLCW